MSHGLPQFFCDVRAEGSNQHGQWFEYLPAGAFLQGQFAGGYHEGRYGGVVGEILYVGTDLLDEFVQALQVVGRGLRVAHLQLVILVPVQSPELLEEAEATVDAGYVPGLTLLDGSKEHLVEAERVGSIAFADVIGVHNIVF